MTCWRRLEEWNRAGVWQRLHQILLADLQGAGRLDWSRTVVDSSHMRAARRGPKAGRARSTGHGRVPSTTS
jgi:transposase